MVTTISAPNKPNDDREMFINRFHQIRIINWIESFKRATIWAQRNAPIQFFWIRTYIHQQARNSVNCSKTEYFILRMPLN